MSRSTTTGESTSDRTLPRRGQRPVCGQGPDADLDFGQAPAFHLLQGDRAGLQAQQTGHVRGPARALQEHRGPRDDREVLSRCPEQGREGRRPWKLVGERHQPAVGSWAIAQAGIHHQAQGQTTPQPLQARVPRQLAALVEVELNLPAREGEGRPVLEGPPLGRRSQAGVGPILDVDETATGLLAPVDRLDAVALFGLSSTAFSKAETAWG
jgi:hypothetical protein